MKYTFNKFSIDDSPAFDGITTGKRWNGWQRPSFSLEVIKQIADWIDPDHVTIIIDGDIVAFVDAGSDNNDLCICESFTVFSVRYYELDGWCWEVCETLEHLQDAVEYAQERADRGEPNSKIALAIAETELQNYQLESEL
jgi:hypothetical protein